MAGFGAGLGEPAADSQSQGTLSGGILTDPWDWLMGCGAQLANFQGCLSCRKPTFCSSGDWRLCLQASLLHPTHRGCLQHRMRGQSAGASPVEVVHHKRPRVATAKSVTKAWQEQLT